MKGLDINGAFCAGWGTTAEHDVHMLKILRDAGAVFYVRTTQPQTVVCEHALPMLILLPKENRCILRLPVTSTAPL